MVHGGGGLDAGPDLVIQGRVAGATAPQDSGWPGRGPAPTFTDFTVQVSEVVAIGGAAPPTQVTVRMMGGTLDGFPPLEVGQEYLLFLRQWFELDGTPRYGPDGAAIYYLNGGPQGYLRIAGGKVEPLVPGVRVVEELRGQPVDEVKQQIKAEKAKKP